MIGDAALDSARFRGDAPADDLVAELGDRIWAVATLVRGTRENQHALPAVLPAAARDYFDSKGRLPAWAERTRLLAAQRFSSQHLLEITIALFHASLPNAYAAEKGARVLFAAGRMTDDLDRRVNETARFVLDVHDDAAFEPHGAALRSVQHVRLMHAVVRRSARARAAAGPEVPLNQEDLLGTLFAFSVTVVRALRRMNVDVTARDADDYYHLWRVLGSLLGVEDALLPRDFAAAEALADRIATRQFRASGEGRALAGVLVRRIDAHVFFPGLSRYLIRRLAGDRVADLLGVPADDSFRKLAILSERVPWLGSVPVHDWLRKAAPLVGQPLLSSVIHTKLGGFGGYDIGAPARRDAV